MFKNLYCAVLDKYFLVIDTIWLKIPYQALNHFKEVYYFKCKNSIKLLKKPKNNLNFHLHFGIPKFKICFKHFQVSIIIISVFNKSNKINF